METVFSEKTIVAFPFSGQNIKIPEFVPKLLAIHAIKGFTLNNRDVSFLLLQHDITNRATADDYLNDILLMRTKGLKNPYMCIFIEDIVLNLIKDYLLDTEDYYEWIPDEKREFPIVECKICKMESGFYFREIKAA